MMDPVMCMIAFGTAIGFIQQANELLRYDALHPQAYVAIAEQAADLADDLRFCDSNNGPRLLPRLEAIGREAMGRAHQHEGATP